LKKRLGFISVVGFVCFFGLHHALAQGTLEDYQRAQRFLPGNLRHVVFPAEVEPHWIEKTNRFWYRRVSPKGTEFILVDAERNTSAPAFDHAQLATALSRVAKQEYEPFDLPFADLDFVNSEKAIRFSIDDAQWTCQLATYECQKNQPSPEKRYEVLSPNKRWAAFVRDHNLYLRDISTGTIVQLTQDGVSGWDYATPLPSLRLMVDQGTEDVRQPAAVFWSPDSTKLITYRIDSRNSGRFTSLQFVPPDQLRPRAFTYVYPLPGEVLAKAEPIIFDIQSGKRIDVPAPLELPFQDGPGFDWFPDSKGFYYDYDERGYKAKELRVVDASTGEQRVLIREQSDSYVDPGETFYRFVDATGEILWSSERDGWNHLYVYSRKTGQLENQVTRGPWVVSEIDHVDEKDRRVYFLANGREKNEDPYQNHLYSVGFDGKDLRMLSPENANHSVSMSPDGSFFVDSYSRPDLPGESVLRRSKDGSDVRTLEKADAGELLKTGWKFPEPFQGKAADGSTDIYGLIWRPSNFDPSKKYPVIEQVYTGPQGFFVPKTFAGTFRLQSMAELGFVVVMVDGRGTVGRSRAFHQFSYRNLGGAFEDHVALIKQMAERYPYMDVTRVGIYGTSAGGYGAAHAMLVFPDFYKVGVTISGDHDARLDKAWWNEAYQGYPVQDDYVAQSNVTMADHLKGHLLVEHGDIDDNVHPVETMRFVDALMKANKNFDMLLVPNMFHGESGEHALYLVRRRWDYFVQYLLGVTPPSNFEIKEDRPPSRSPRRRRG
jgi:dipeptidyl-peptidase 4